ncbi:kinase-like domain-containing protein [Crassisporium funariophilum]|nr:kinase-like domain-containing protein [Crassisporium funariophilum]
MDISNLLPSNSELKSLPQKELEPSLLEETLSWDRSLLPTSFADLQSKPVLFLQHSTRIARLQPGVLVKCKGATDLTDEADAMKYARLQLGALVPQLLYHLPRSKSLRYDMSAGSHGLIPPGSKGIWYLCIEECAGTALNEVIDTMSPSELDHIAAQLSGILARMTRITSSFVGTVLGEPLRNMWVSEALPPDRTFASTSEFTDYYRETFLEADVVTEKWIDTELAPLRRNVEFTFTHGDLLPKNIMVEGSTITGILDWATGGFYPSYWEYCSMHDPFCKTPGWDYVLSRVFPGERRMKEIKAVRTIRNVLVNSLCQW